MPSTRHIHTMSQPEWTWLTVPSTILPALEGKAFATPEPSLAKKTAHEPASHILSSHVIWWFGPIPKNSNHLLHDISWYHLCECFRDIMLAPCSLHHPTPISRKISHWQKRMFVSYGQINEHLFTTLFTVFFAGYSSVLIVWKKDATKCHILIGFGRQS